MAIALRAQGAWSFGINGFSPVIPTAQLTGDMMILFVGGKGFDAAFSVSGWTALTRGESGTQAAGADSGSVVIQAFWKEATSDTETDPSIVEGTPAWNVIGGAVCVFSKGANEAWATPVDAVALDETDGTDLSFTYGSNPGGTSGDYVTYAVVTNSDVFGPLTTDLTPAWTGITFGTQDAGVEGETTSGGDMTAHYGSRPVNSGTASAAPTATGTGTSSATADKAESVFIRLRVSTQVNATATPAAVAAVAAIDLATITRSAEVAAPIVSSLASVGQVVVETGTPATVTPAVVAAVTTVDTATAQASSTATPGVVAAIATVPLAVITATAEVVANVVAAIANVFTPTVDTGEEPYVGSGSPIINLFRRRGRRR